MREFKTTTLWRITMEEEGRSTEVLMLATNFAEDALCMALDRFPKKTLLKMENAGELTEEVR